MNKPFINGVYLPQNKVVDIHGVVIRPGQRIRVLAGRPRLNGIWEANTQFEDGVLTVSILDVVCIENPKGWDNEHDWTESRRWSTSVGYGEYGSWNVARQPLTHFAMIHDQEQWKALAEKFGHANRYLNVEVLGPAIKIERVSS